MRLLVLLIVLVSSLFIACGSAPKKTVDRDGLDREADKSQRELDREMKDY